jgi:hypothetical protein
MAIIALIRIVRMLTGYVTDEEIASFAGEFTTPARERAE